MHFVVKKDGAYTLPQFFTRPWSELKAEDYDKHIYNAEVNKSLKQINECLSGLKNLLNHNASYEEAYNMIKKYFDIVEDDEKASGIMCDCLRPQTLSQSLLLEIVVENFNSEPINAVKFFIAAQSDITSFFDSYYDNDEEIKKLKNYASKNAKRTKAYEKYLSFCAFFVNNYWEEIKQVIKVK